MDSPVRILVLCTGNICRSPMAEGLLRDRLIARDVDAEVSSAGLSFDDRAATDEAVHVAEVAGIDIRPHRSRILDRAILADADLVLTMERMHAREAIVLDRTALDRCFTLKELVRRGARVGPRQAGEPLAQWLGRASGGRRTVELLGESREDDVADPYRSSLDVYERCFAELTDLVDRLVDLAWPADARRREGVA